MGEITEIGRPRFRLTLIFWVGFGIFVAGSGPLLLVILLAGMGIGDPDPNPIGFGLLAFFTFWPSIGFIVAGLTVSMVRYRSARKDDENGNG